MVWSDQASGILRFGGLGNDSGSSGISGNPGRRYGVGMWKRSTLSLNPNPNRPLP